MLLALTTSQIHQLQFWSYDIVRILNICLRNCETQDTVTPAARFIDPMTSHHFVLKPLPKVLKTVINRGTFKLVYVFYGYIIIASHFDLQPRNTLQGIFAAGYLVLVRIQQIIYLFIVKLNVLARDGDLVSVARLVLLELDEFEQLPDAPRYQAVGHGGFLSWIFRHLGHDQIRLFGVRNVLVTFHRVGFTGAGLAVRENRGMKAHYHLFDVKRYFGLLKNDFLRVGFTEDLIELEGFILLIVGWHRWIQLIISIGSMSINHDLYSIIL